MSSGLCEKPCLRRWEWLGRILTPASSFHTHKYTGTQVHTHGSHSHWHIQTSWSHMCPHKSQGNKFILGDRKDFLSLVIFSKWKKNSKYNKKFPFLGYSIKWIALNRSFNTHHLYGKALLKEKTLWPKTMRYLSHLHFYSCAKANLACLINSKFGSWRICPRNNSKLCKSPFIYVINYSCWKHRILNYPAQPEHSNGKIEWCTNPDLKPQCFQNLSIFPWQTTRQSFCRAMRWSLLYNGSFGAPCCGEHDSSG